MMANGRAEDRESSQQEWYRQYYGKAGRERNDLRRNPEVLFQWLAMEASVIRAVRHISHEPLEAYVLDVGCGSAGDVHQLLRLSYDVTKITGIEVQAERLCKAQRTFPQACFIHGDATRMDFEDNSFDLVFESTLFATLPHDKERKAIASEMVRVCRPGGYLLLVDWRTPKPGDPNYKALTKKELRTLFSVGSTTRLANIARGALVPPIGRFLSKHAPALYFLVSGMLPFLVGQVVYLLRKAGDREV